MVTSVSISIYRRVYPGMGVWLGEWNGDGNLLGCLQTSTPPIPHPPHVVPVLARVEIKASEKKIFIFSFYFSLSFITKTHLRPPRVRKKKGKKGPYTNFVHAWDGIADISRD